MTTEFPTLAQTLAAHAVSDYVGLRILCLCEETFPGVLAHAEHQAAMWQQTCRIEIADQLDALPVGSVIVDRDGRAYQSLQRPGRQAPAWLARGYRYLADEIPLPAQHIWTPNE